MSKPKKTLEEKMFDEVTIDDTISVQTTGEKIPDRRSEKWSQYVLSHLTKEEQDPSGKFPKTDALPRLIEKFIGPILKSCSRVVVEPSSDNGQKVMVEHNLIVEDTAYGLNREVTSVGEASELKLTVPYNLYSGAIASTRAMGRSYKTILELKNTLVAEEMSGSIEQNEDTITDNQIVGITNLCKRLNIPMEEMLRKKYGAFSQIKELDKEFGKSILTYLNKVEQGEESYS